MQLKMRNNRFDVAVIGAGIVGIACAYYLKQLKPSLRVLLLDAGQPMALTSAQSGENYRNWWPHPVMSNFIDRSIDLMEDIAKKSDNRINLTRRGYALATRDAKPDDLMSELEFGYSESAPGSIRVHSGSSLNSYCPPDECVLENAPVGVDVIQDTALIRQVFPSYDKTIATLIHVRRAGSVDSQQLGQFMLESFASSGGKRLTGKVIDIATSHGFEVLIDGAAEPIRTNKIINVAGPFINDIATMLGMELPVSNTLQQKIAFEDWQGVVPRSMPFSIDLDDQLIDWTAEEKQLLGDDNDFAKYAQLMPGSIHCRPDGGDSGRWVKLGWAYNNTATAPQIEPVFDEEFPEIVLRGAARLNPALKAYYGQLPRNTRHYGGYYTLTEENWPLVGPMAVADSYIAGAMSGFGTMAACASGELCAQHVLDLPRPNYAKALSPQRYENVALMHEIRALSSRGIL